MFQANAVQQDIEITWIKLTGTLKKGRDLFDEYYYIEANSFEVMNERGQDTVNN